MERRRRLFFRLMVAFICSICCVPSSVVAQQKLDQAAVENYEKSLALNSKNWELVDRLKSLREKQGRGGQ
jgi:hypothetical protein